MCREKEHIALHAIRMTVAVLSSAHQGRGEDSPLPFRRRIIRFFSQSWETAKSLRDPPRLYRIYYVINPYVIIITCHVNFEKGEITKNLEILERSCLVHT